MFFDLRLGAWFVFESSDYWMTFRNSHCDSKRYLVTRNAREFKTFRNKSQVVLRKINCLFMPLRVSIFEYFTISIRSGSFSFDKIILVRWRQLTFPCETCRDDIMAKSAFRCWKIWLTSFSRCTKTKSTQVNCLILIPVVWRKHSSINVQMFITSSNSNKDTNYCNRYRILSITELV